MARRGLGRSARTARYRISSATESLSGPGIQRLSGVTKRQRGGALGTTHGYVEYEMNARNATYDILWRE